MLVTLPQGYLKVSTDDLREAPKENFGAALLLSLMSVNHSSKEQDGSIIKEVDGFKGFYYTPLNVKILLEQVIKEQFPDFHTVSDDGGYVYPEINCKCETEEYDKHELSAYGVCDSPEQFAEHFQSALEADPRNFIATFWEVRREDQSEDGGWRYHKWGQYIGNQKPQQEYLYDDKHIERVYCWHIYEVEQ